MADWKNRKSDNGAYVFNGELNFYNYIYSNEAPVVTGEYTYYVITREASSKKVLIYTDARVKIDFVDANNDAIIDQDGVLNLFYDDLQVPNEASSGAVAMLKLYNYRLDSTAIQARWDQLGSNVFGVNETKKSDVQITIFPNPASDYLNINLSAFALRSDAEITVVNEIGLAVHREKLTIRNTSHNLSLSHYKPGLYSLIIESKNQISRSKFVVN